MTMTDDPFTAPASSSGIKWEDYKGALLLFTVKGHETGINTSLGERDAIRADVAVLDGPNATESLDDILVFPRVLQGQLRSRVGQMVLGRLSQGAAKPGQNPPWKLDDPADPDKQIARAYVAKNAPPPF